MTHPARRRVLAAATALIFGLTLALTGPTGIAAADPMTTSVETLSYPRYGQHGSKVQALQNRLIAAGLLKAELNGGTYGKHTKAAVKRLQQAYDLRQTGKVNAATDAALTKAVGAATVRRPGTSRRRSGSRPAARTSWPTAPARPASPS